MKVYLLMEIEQALFGQGFVRNVYADKKMAQLEMKRRKSKKIFENYFYYIVPKTLIEKDNE